MKLVHATGYSIRLVAPLKPDLPPTSELWAAGGPTGVIVSGAVFEVALRWGEYLLLFLTDDVPFEDGLNIHLLDKNLKVVDSAHMAFMYSTGIFSDLDLTQSDSVSFCFFGGMVWTLKLFSKKKFAFPIISDPLSVSRPFKFSRMFQIDRRNLPS
jgi:hypothetical protein